MDAKLSGKTAAETARAQKTFEKFRELPDEIAKQVFRALPINEQGALARTSKYYFRFLSQHIYTAKLLMLVAHGEQERAAHMLEKKPGLLVELADVTDYSGRTFKHITAYEYAYWAKDTHMCRMLERYMDANTATIMHQRCLAIEKNGLTYKQHGQVVKHSKHFDMTPLKTALKTYVDGYDAWHAENNSDAMYEASMRIQLAQRDVPVHVINEYCRADRSFSPRPEFNEGELPRSTRYINCDTRETGHFFPVVAHYGSVLYRDNGGVAGLIGKLFPRVRARVLAENVAVDLPAISYLDEVRTADRTQSRANLGLIEQDHDHGLVS